MNGQIFTAKIQSREVYTYLPTYLHSFKRQSHHTVTASETQKNIYLFTDDRRQTPWASNNSA